jgi:hypothetical protein
MKPQEGKSADVCKAAALLDIVLVDTISAMRSSLVLLSPK